MDHLAAICERVARVRQRARKIAIVAEYLDGLADGDREHALGILRRGPAVGHATLREALRRACGWDVETIRECRRAVGDTGETVALLMTGLSTGTSLPLAEAARLFAALARERRTARKIEILEACFRRYAPAALKCFVRALTGNHRIGLTPAMIEEAAGGARPERGKLCTVVTAASLDEFTFAVRAEDGFLNVGKAVAEFAEDELSELARRLRDAATERFGRTLVVRPEVVVEVAFDGIEKSSRRKSGYALVAARIVRWRRDMRPEEADDLDRVRALYEASLG
jgi:ATP-dependent DNA ligase